MHPLTRRYILIGDLWLEVDVKKYEELYKYQKEQFDAARARFNRLEEKAVKFLTSATFALSAYVLLVRWVSDKIFPPQDVLGWAVVISIVFTFLSLCSTWSMVLRSIKLRTLVKLKADNEMIEFFKKQKLDTVYLALARRYAQGIDKTNEEYEKKLKYVRKAYNEIVFSGWCFFTSTILIFVEIWSKT
ncbi:hypothetical protein ACIX9V_004391 [Vibrio vulnificus]